MITVIESALFALITLAIIVITSIAEPRRVRCPSGWYAEGVRPSGATTCRRAPINDITPPTGAIDALVYCTGGSLPIVIDHRTVGCNRRNP